MIFVAGVIAIIAVVGIVIGLTQNAKGWLAGGVLGVIAALVLGIFSMAYTQGAGEAKVIVSFTGEVKGDPDTTEGLGWHAPFDNLVDYDIRNKQAAFINANNTKIKPEDLLGGELDFTDKNGAAGKLDIIVRYSLKPGSVGDIYRAFGTQDKFEATLISPEIKTAIKEVPGAFSTIEMRTDRAKVGAAIEKNLVEKWAKEGVIVDEVSLQDVRYSDEVNRSFDEAQIARNRVTTEKANLEATEISSQKQVVEAQAQKKANDLVTSSLTPEVLKLRGIEMLEKAAEKGNTIFTDGSTYTQFPITKK